MTALITGASVGIGRDLARLFAADGHSLVITARNQQQLDAVAQELRDKHKVRVEVMAKDLSRPNAAVELVDQIHAANISIDCLVNNAGFGAHGLFHQTEVQKQLDMLQVNIVALTELTRLLLAQMVERRAGRVMNIASTAAFQPGPYMAVYYASKAYVLSFSEAISSELEGTGVTVTVVCPGPTITEFHQRANVGQLPLFQHNTMSSQDVAKIAYRATLRGQRVAVAGIKNWILTTLSLHTPHFLVLPSVKKLQASR